MTSKPECPKLRKLRTIACKWGGSIVQVTAEEYDALREHDHPSRLNDAPFSSHSLGVIHSEKKIVYAEDTRGAASKSPPWYEFVHEMGHVFACTSIPSMSKEYDFFGWEYAMALKFDAVKEWVDGNKDYSVGEGDDLSTLSPAEVQKILEERLSVAVSLGLVVNGQPIAIR